MNDLSNYPSDFTEYKETPYDILKVQQAICVLAVCDFCANRGPSYFFILPWIVDKQANNVHCCVVTACKQHFEFLEANVLQATKLTDGLCKGGPADKTSGRH